MIWYPEPLPELVEGSAKGQASKRGRFVKLSVPFGTVFNGVAGSADPMPRKMLRLSDGFLSITDCDAPAPLEIIAILFDCVRNLIQV